MAGAVVFAAAAGLPVPADDAAVAGTAPVRSARFLAFMSSVTFLKPGKQEGCHMSKMGLTKISQHRSQSPTCLFQFKVLPYSLHL